jgi:putative hydrolase of the HAD superfamily
MSINLQHINTVIFDLGGVILNLDYNITIQAFKNLGILNVETLFSQKEQIEIFNQLETGSISESDFRNKIRSFSPQNITDQEIDYAWNQMLLDLPIERHRLIQKVSRDKRIFLLSNTNSIHMKWFKEYTNKLLGENTFFTTFEVAYLSHEIKMRKPHSQIFEYVISQNDLSPENTLFIDDSEQHILGAKKTGLQTYWLQPHENILDLFSSYYAIS